MQPSLVSWKVHATAAGNPAGRSRAKQHAPLANTQQHGARTRLFRHASPQPHHNRQHRLPRLAAAAAAAAADSGAGGPPSDGDLADEEYVVQPGDTLWDIAQQYGVHVRALKQRNGLVEHNPVLTPGQVLSIPSAADLAAATTSQRSWRTAPPAAAAAAATAVQDRRGSAAPKGGTGKDAGAGAHLWDNDPHVLQVSLEEAQQLYMQLCDRAAQEHTLLVVYTDWCPHCKTIAPEVSRLAAGLAYDPQIQVAALDSDAPAARYFARQVLGVQYFPSFVVLPAHSRTYYKYKGSARDADSLLRFLNMVCKGGDDVQWQLLSSEQQQALGAGGGAAPRHKAPGGPAFLGVAAAQQDSAGWGVGNTAGPLLAGMGVVGVAAFAALRALSSAPGLQQQAERMAGRGGGVVPEPVKREAEILDASANQDGLDPSIPLFGAASPSQQQQQQQQLVDAADDARLHELVGAVDSTIASMASVLLRLVRARAEIAVAGLTSGFFQGPGRPMLAPPAEGAGDGSSSSIGSSSSSSNGSTAGTSAGSSSGGGPTVAAAQWAAPAADAHTSGTAGRHGGGGDAGADQSTAAGTTSASAAGPAADVPHISQNGNGAVGHGVAAAANASGSTKTAAAAAVATTAATHDPAASAAATFSAASSPVVRDMVSELEHLAVRKLDAAEVLRMLDDAGDDISAVVDKLLQAEGAAVDAAAAAATATARAAVGAGPGAGRAESRGESPEPL